MLTSISVLMLLASVSVLILLSSVAVLVPLTGNFVDILKLIRAILMVERISKDPGHLQSHTLNKTVLDVD